MNLPPNRMKYLHWLCVSLLPIATASCVYQSVAPHVQAPVEVAFDNPLPATASAAIQADLWQSFNDQVLSQLQARALQENRSLRQVSERMEAARAERGLAISALFPSVSIDANRNSEVPSKLNPTIPPTIRKLNTFNAALDSRWEVDLFGAAINGAKAAQADYRTAQADLVAAKQALLAEIAQAYFNLRADQQHLSNAQHRAAAAGQLWLLTQARVKAGKISGIDAATVESQVAQARAGLTPAQAQVSADIHRLMVLTVWSQAEIVALTKPAEFPQIPPLVSVGTPTDWLVRRPDVRSAEQQFRGAVARSNVVRAEYFPQITLNGSYGYNSQTAATIGTSASRQWNFGPSISWNFLNLGQTIYQIKGANAAARQALAQFDETILKALEETNNGFANYSAASESLSQWQIAKAASEQQLKLTTEQFAAGSADLGTVLNARLRDYDTADQFVTAQLRQASSLAVLYRALAGDFAVGR